MARLLRLVLTLCFWAPLLGSQVSGGDRAAIPSQSGLAIGNAAPALRSIYDSPFAQNAWGHHNLILENGYTEDMMHQVLRGGYVDDSLAVAQLVPASARTQTNVISTWQRTFSNKAEPVGVYSQCNVAVDRATCWGLNPVVNDYDVDGTTRSGTTLFGVEIDANVQSRSTAGAALFFGADMKAQPLNLGVIHIPAPVGAGHYKYNYGLWIDDGAVQTVGLHLGALEAGPGSSGSQMLEFKSREGPSGDRSAFLFTDPSGALHLRSRTLGNLSGDLLMEDDGVTVLKRNGTLRLGSPGQSNSPRIDFHSGGTAVPYDVRLRSTGGSSQAGQGTLDVLAREIHLPAATAGSLAIAQKTPASSHTRCAAGQIWSDDHFIYVCTSQGRIKRAALSDF